MPRDLVEFPEVTIPIPATDAVLRVLERLREFHSDPANWCNDEWSIIGERGHALCIVRAAAHFGSDDVAQRDGALSALRRALPDDCRDRPGGLVFFNERNGTTHAALMAFYDRAIAARRAELEA